MSCARPTDKTNFAPHKFTHRSVMTSPHLDGVCRAHVCCACVEKARQSITRTVDDHRRSDSLSRHPIHSTAAMALTNTAYTITSSTHSLYYLYVLCKAGEERAPSEGCCSCVGKSLPTLHAFALSSSALEPCD